MPKTQRMMLMETLGLPQFTSIEELSRLTRLSTRLLYCLSIKTENYYRIKHIPKRTGGVRELSIPSFSLHIMQRWILVKILDHIKPSQQSMAFRKGCEFGHKQNAIFHAGSIYGLSIDLKDFFPSITSDKVYTIFSELGYNNFAATILTNICTLDGRLPQGSAASPAISNLVCKTLDNRLNGLCKKRGIIYTRYADDMYFSCDDKTLLHKNYSSIIKIINSEGFTINQRKVHWHTPSNRKRITGITVISKNDDAHVVLKTPKNLKRKIRAEIHRCVMSGDYTLKSHVCGEISYVSYVEGDGYKTSLTKYIDSLAHKIQMFPELVEAYNANLFFKDIPPLVCSPVEIDDENDFLFFEDIYNQRKSFLQTNSILDICQYQNWPDSILNPSPIINCEDNLPW